MDKIKEYFNNRAADWDSHSIANAEKVEKILKISELEENSEILDIACGTGIMEEFLIKHNPKSILAVDIAENMIKQAKEKYNDPRIEFLCEDVFNIKDKKFDFIIIYNAFPHFLEPEKFISHIHRILKENGKFVICHGMGRKDLNGHHKRVANEISLGLAPAEETASMLNGFEVKTIIDEKEVYIVYAIKK